MTYCVETTDLAHRYSNQGVILHGIDLRVPQASIYGFLGPNGAGKTTTLRLILGLLKKQRGDISIFGKKLETHRVEILKNIGSLIESPSLYDHLTARENLALYQKIHQCPKTRIEHVLDLVGLSDTANKKTSQFSLGMKQRLSIAVALLHNPNMLILDEPTNGLDPNGIIEIRELLLRLNRDNGTTIMLSSHLLAEIEKLVTHVGIISRGRMMFQGTMHELKQKQQQVLATFISTNDDTSALKILAQENFPARISEGKIVMPALRDEQIAAINRRLLQCGVDVHEIGARRHDLETIFIGLVAEANA